MSDDRAADIAAFLDWLLDDYRPDGKRLHLVWWDRGSPAVFEEIAFDVGHQRSTIIDAYARRSAVPPPATEGGKG